MHGHLRRRNPKSATAAGIDVLEAEDVGQERAIGVGVAAEHDDVRAADRFVSAVSAPAPPTSRQAGRIAKEHA